MKDTLGVWLARLLGSLNLSVNRGIGFMLASGVWLFNGRTRKVTQKNIQLCFPNLSAVQQQVLARASVNHTMLTLVEAFRCWCQPFSLLKGEVRQVHNQVHWDQCLADGKGLIVIGPHFGNWEVLGLHLAETVAITNLYEEPKHKAVGDLMKSGRQQQLSKLAPANRKGVAMLVKALERGECIGILPDQVPTGGAGVLSLFMGQPALTMTLVHKLLKKTGAKAVMAVAQRVDEGFEIHYLPVDPAIYSDDMQASVDALNRSVESCVALAPSQYQWEYKRFRRLPEGYPQHYSKASLN